MTCFVCVRQVSPGCKVSTSIHESVTSLMACESWRGIRDRGLGGINERTRKSCVRGDTLHTHVHHRKARHQVQGEGQNREDGQETKTKTEHRIDISREFRFLFQMH